MRKVIWATPLYKFLRYCNDSQLDKTVLDCGAGGDDPPLQLFYEYGYKTFGVEVSEDPFRQAKKFCRERSMELNILKGDMRSLSFKSRFFSFAYSFNAIFFMSKKDIAISIKEIERVLKPNGLCFVNFISIDEPDRYFQNFKLIHKEKRIVYDQRETKQNRIKVAYIDYIAKRK